MGHVILADFNQPLRKHYDEGDWLAVVAGLKHPNVAQPAADGVDDLLEAKGFRCAFGLAGQNNNFGGRSSPPMTHWTGTTIDFAYLHLANSSSIVNGAYVQYTDLSDHAPVIVVIMP